MRYKLVACVLLILSVFGFVLAAPVAVQEVCEACVDAVDGGENVIIESGKRAEVQEEGGIIFSAKLCKWDSSEPVAPVR